jgi:hypothetical protein
VEEAAAFARVTKGKLKQWIDEGLKHGRTGAAHGETGSADIIILREYLTLPMPEGRGFSVQRPLPPVGSLTWSP